MASPDLYAQKILGTDPRVGFGESFVLPPITRGFDDTLYQHIGAVDSREQQARQQQMKMAYDNAKLANVDSPGKGSYDIQRVRSQYIGQMQEMINTGNFAPTTALSMESALNELKALDKREHDVFLANDKLVDEFQQKYGDRYLGGQAKEINRNIYFGTPNDQSYYRNATQVASTLDPSQNVNLYDAQRSRQVFVDNYSKGLQQSISSGSTIEDEFSKKHTENSFAGTFLTKDSKGNWIPGVDDRHVKEYFTFDDGITKKWYDNQTANAFLKDAETLYNQVQQDPTNPANSKFANMTQQEVYTKILESNPLKNGQSFGEYSFNNAKRDLEAYNKIKTDTNYSRENKEQQIYSNGGNKDLGLYVTSGKITQDFPTFDKKDGNWVVRPNSNWRANISAIQLNNDKGRDIASVTINPQEMPTNILPWKMKGQTGTVDFTPTNIGVHLYNAKTGQPLPGSTTELVRKLQTGDKSLQEAIKNGDIVLRQVAFGKFATKASDATLPKGQSNVATKQLIDEETGKQYSVYTQTGLLPLTESNMGAKAAIYGKLDWQGGTNILFENDPQFMQAARVNNPEMITLMNLVNNLSVDF
jgi:hypothetical protein